MAGWGPEAVVQPLLEQAPLLVVMVLASYPPLVLLLVRAAPALNVAHGVLRRLSSHPVQRLMDSAVLLPIPAPGLSLALPSPPAEAVLNQALAVMPKLMVLTARTPRTVLGVPAPIFHGVWFLNESKGRKILTRIYLAI